DGLVDVERYVIAPQREPETRLRGFRRTVLLSGRHRPSFRPPIFRSPCGPPSSGARVGCSSVPSRPARNFTKSYSGPDPSPALAPTPGGDSIPEPARLAQNWTRLRPNPVLTRPSPNAGHFARDLR